MTRIVLLFLTVFGLSASTAQARTCRDGKTVYQQAGVRVFSQGGGFWACGKATRRPVHLASYTGPYGSFEVFGRRGGKVVFVFEFSGEGGGEDTSVGWFDGRRARAGQLAGHVSNDVLDVAVASDGGMAVVSSLEENTGTRVGYLAPGRDELVLATVGGRYAKRSLAVTAGGLRWRTADGRTRRVPLTGEPLSCTAGTTLLEHAGARLFEVFKGARDRLAACLPGDVTPRVLDSTPVRDQDVWTLVLVKRAGARVAFLANDRIGLLDGPTISVVRPPGFDALDDVALATAGPPVFASQGSVLRLDGTPIASLGGALEPGTLALTDDGRVRWRNADGRVQDVPLAGEATLTCTSGTTLLEKDGLRVFEVHTDAPRLYGCTPGVPEPARLLAQGASERVVELTRRHGWIALYVVSRSGDRVVVLGPAGVRVKAPRESLSYAELRDVTIAPDGSRISWRDRKGRPHTLDL